MLEAKDLHMHYAASEIPDLLETIAFDAWWGKLSDSIEPEVWVLWANNDFEIRVEHMDNGCWDVTPILEDSSD